MRVFPGWWQVAVSLILQAASSASIFTAYSVIAVPLQETFEPTRVMLMMGITAVSLAAGVMNPPLGAAIDRFSVRLLMFAGTLLLGAGFVALSFATDMTQVLLVYLIILSLGSVLTGPLAGSALMARWFTRRRGLAMGIAASGSAVGGLIIPPVLQFLIDAFEWRTALRIFGVSIFLITGPLVAFFVINRPSDRNLYPDGDEEPPATAADHPHENAGSVLFFLRNRNFWLIAVCLGFLFACTMGLLSNLVPFVLDKNIDAAKGALLLSIFSAANFLGKLTSGAIADMVDFRIMLSGIAILMSVGMLGYVQVDTFVILAGFSVVMGLSQGAMVPLWSVIVARVYGAENVGRSMGTMALVITPFTLVAAPLFGWVYDLSGSYDNALYGAVVLLLCSLVLIAMMREESAVTPGGDALR